MINWHPTTNTGSREVQSYPASGTFGFGDAYGDLVDISRLRAIVITPSATTAPIRPGPLQRPRRYVYHSHGLAQACVIVAQCNLGSYRACYRKSLANGTAGRTNRRALLDDPMSVASSWVIRQGVAQAGIGVPRCGIAGRRRAGDCPDSL